MRDGMMRAGPLFHKPRLGCPILRGFGGGWETLCVLRCLKPLVRRSQPTGDVKLGKSCVTVCHIEKPEAIRDRKPGSEMQVQSLVTDDVEERVRPKRRRDREAREVSSVYRDVSRPPILGNEVGEYEDPARWDGPNELVIGHDTAVKVNEAPLGNVGYGWIRHTSLSWRRTRRNGMRDSAAPIYTRAKKIPLCRRILLPIQKNRKPAPSRFLQSTRTHLVNTSSP